MLLNFFASDLSVVDHFEHIGNAIRAQASKLLISLVDQNPTGVQFPLGRPLLNRLHRIFEVYLQISDCLRASWSQNAFAVACHP